MTQELIESTVISNVPQQLVERFSRAFPDQAMLVEYVRRGWCDNVDTILSVIGNYDKATDEYIAFNDEQKAVVRAWWDLFSDTWF